MERVLEEEESQQLGKVIKYESERQGKLLAMMEPKKNLMSEAPEDLRNLIFQEIRDLDEKISGEEVELLERKRILEELLKEGRNAEVEEERELQLLLEVGFTRQAAAMSQSAGT